MKLLAIFNIVAVAFPGFDSSKECVQSKWIVQDTIDGLINIYSSFADLVEQASPHIVWMAFKAQKDEVEETAYKVIGHLSSASSESIIDAIFSSKYLDLADKLLRKPEFKNKSEILWTLSNLTASKERHIEAVISHKVFATALDFCDLNNSAAVRQEAVFMLTNAITISEDDQLLLAIVNERILYTLIQTLKVAKENRFIEEILQAIGRIFELDNEHDRDFIQTCEKFGFVDVIDEMDMKMQECTGAKTLLAMMQHQQQKSTQNNVQGCQGQSKNSHDEFVI